MNGYDRQIFGDIPPRGILLETVEFEGETKTKG